MKVWAVLSDQGTAMAETAVCDDHRRDNVTRREVMHAVFAADDWGGGIMFEDCTGNEALTCITCGYPDD